MEKLNEYAEKFPQGSVVYYIDTINGIQLVYFGLAHEYFHDALYIKLLHMKDNRLINGIPYNEFKTPTRKKKLPKGWTYSTDLFEQTYDDSCYEEFCKIKINDPELILNAYNKGYLIDAEKYDASWIKSVIEQDGYYLTREYPSIYNCPESRVEPYIFVPYHKVYHTYEEAQKVIDDWNAEQQRRAAQTDYEWNAENLDYELNRFQHMYNKSDEDIQQIRDFILALPDFEDLEFKIFDKVFQFKNCNKKKWKNAEFA